MIGDSTLAVKKGPYLPENGGEVRNPTYQPNDMESKIFDNDSHFKTPQEIPNEELTKAIKIGFQLNKDKKISLKEYYEGAGEHSLYQLAGISLKFETIRQKDLYKELNKLK